MIRQHKCRWPRARALLAGTGARDLARAVAISPTAASLVLRGTLRPSAATTARIAAATGIARDLLDLAWGRVPGDITAALTDGGPRALEAVRAALAALGLPTQPAQPTQTAQTAQT